MTNILDQIQETVIDNFHPNVVSNMTIIDGFSWLGTHKTDCGVDVQFENKSIQLRERNDGKFLYSEDGGSFVYSFSNIEDLSSHLAGFHNYLTQ